MKIRLVSVPTESYNVKWTSQIIKSRSDKRSYVWGKNISELSYFLDRVDKWLKSAPDDFNNTKYYEWTKSVHIDFHSVEELNDFVKNLGDPSVFFSLVWVLHS